MSLDKNLNVAVTADSSQFERGMRQAAAESRKFERELVKQQKAADQFRENTGRAMVGAGVAILAGVGMSVKAASDWESAWAGVTKTVDGNAQQMAELEGQLRQLARELPATHTEIAAVAEAAGQLGVQRENIAGFTRTMIDLGETTNLSADQAATSLARFSNIMGTSQSDVDRLGSVLVGLGNNAATTEAEILTLGTRLAAAGKIAGLSEADVFAFASTLTSVGVEAEAGGTALSKVFTKIRDSVLDGGEELEIFAEVAGVTAEKFARDFERDPAQAIAAFIDGLGRMNESGKSTTQVFKDLGLEDQRLMRALLSTAGAGDLLTTQIGLANEEWVKNSALVEEAAKRYDTTESKLKVARGNIEDLAITIGQGLLPVLGAAAESTSGFVSVISDLPGPVKQAAGIVGALLGTVSVLGGTMLLAGPKVHRFRASLDAMGGAAARANKGLGAVGRFMTGPWGLALAVATIAIGVFAAKKAEAQQRIEGFTEALEADNGELGEHTRQAIAATIAEEGLVETAKDAGVELSTVAQAIAGDNDAWVALNAHVSDLNEEIARLSRILPSELSPAQRQHLADLVAERDATIDLIGTTKGLNGEVETSRDEYALATEAEKAAKQARDETTESTEDGTAALEDYLEAIRKSTDPVFNLFAALESVDQAQRDYNKAVRKFGQDSPQARKAAVDLGKAVASAEQAALDGDLSFGDFQSQLRSWVKQGVITAGQAKAIEGRVKGARKEAEKYTGRYDAEVHADTSPAERAIRNFIETTSGRKISLNIEGGFGSGPGLAAGGPVRGPGGPTDDRVPAWLSAGEYVINAREAGRNWQLLEAINKGRVPAFAEGGPVTLDVHATGLKALEKKFAASMSSGGGSGGAERWRGVALQALAYTGSPLHWIDELLRRMNQESGGNPRAINLWDSNAAAGIPSQGLMQTIPPTFYAYARELAGLGIYNPFANIVASIRYANARYGSAPVGWNQPGGYDDGGLATGRGFMMKQTLKPERVLSPQQTERFDQLVQVLDRTSTPASATPAVDYAKLGESVADALHRKGVRITGGKLSGKLDIGPGRNGGIVGMMRDVAAEEARDEADWRRGS